MKVLTHFPIVVRFFRLRGEGPADKRMIASLEMRIGLSRPTVGGADKIKLKAGTVAIRFGKPRAECQ